MMHSSIVIRAIGLFFLAFFSFACKEDVPSLSTRNAREDRQIPNLGISTGPRSQSRPSIPSSEATPKPPTKATESPSTSPPSSKIDSPVNRGTKNATQFSADERKLDDRWNEK